MNKKMLFAAALIMGAGSASGSKFFRAQLTPDGSNGGGKTDAELKTEAEANVRTIASKAALDALPDAIKNNLNSEETKTFLSAAINKALEEAKIKDVDGSLKTLSEIVKGVQDQHEALAMLVKNGGGSMVKEGLYIAFVNKNIAENANIGDNRGYSAKMTIKAAELMTIANVKPNVAGGFSPLLGNFIDMEIGHVPKPENVMLPLINVRNQPGTENIWYTDRVNEQGDAAFIAEGSLKPLISADYQTAKAPVKEVAERWKFTKRLMNHAPSVVSDFLEHAKELMDSKVDDGVLSGDGTGNNLSGLAKIAAAFIVPTQLAAFYPNANIFDAVNAMAARIRLSNFKGQLTAVLNTVWETKFMGYKDLEGRYLVPDFVSADGKKIGSVNIIFSNKIADTKILIGDLKRFNLVWAETITYDEGYENDDFSKNLVSRKMEAFLGTYIKASDAGSILMDDIATVLTAINKPAVPAG